MDKWKRGGYLLQLRLAWKNLDKIRKDAKKKHEEALLEIVVSTAGLSKDQEKTVHQIQTREKAR